MANAVECRRCNRWVPFPALIVNPYTRIAHCPYCATPIASIAEIARTAGVPVEQLLPKGSESLQADPVAPLSYDSSFDEWPAGENGEHLRRMQAAGELIVVDHGLQVTGRYGIIILRGGGERRERGRGGIQ